MSQSLKALLEKSLGHYKQLHPTSLPSAFVDGITLSMRYKGQTEIVALQYRSESVAHSCTCGRAECEHVLLTMQWVLGQEEQAQAKTASLEGEITREKSGLTGVYRTIPSLDRPPIEDTTSFAARLNELATSAVRAGVDAVDSPSVEDNFTGLVHVAPKPHPLGFERWLGRVKRAISQHDADQLASQLFAGAQISRDLNDHKQEGRARLAAWFGTRGFDSSISERMQDRVLIEIAREWLSGTRRASLERRYFVDTLSGEVFREERLQGGDGASSGPCPRIVHVGLAQVYPGVPRRIRLLQYVVSGKVPFADWSRIESMANTQFEELLPFYRNAINSFAGLAEPFVWIKPVRLEQTAAGAYALDEAGMPLPLASADAPSEIDLLFKEMQSGNLQWLAGRLIDSHGTLMLRVRSIMRLDGKELKHTRI
ncbi:MAG: hypothetical protein IPJ88_12740 [Myxococcales bacterium]|nr:MAG: hypothetical protein IPJ88_12740 [Myxococcales bacterium]